MRRLLPRVISISVFTGFVMVALSQSFTMRDIAWLAVQSSSSSSTITVTNYEPNMLEYWEYNKGGRGGAATVGPATNVVVTNWFGQILGTILTNGVGARQPTNSTKGLGFGASLFGLTNIPLVIGTNWIVTIIGEITDNGTVINSGGGTVGMFGAYGSSGTFATKQELLVGFGGAGKGQYQMYAANSVGMGAPPAFPLPQSKFFVLSVLNTNGSAIKNFMFTNGVSMGNTSVVGSSLGQTNSFLGYDGYNTGNGDAGFDGFIEGYYIQTNSVPWTDAQVGTIISNFFYYYQNVSNFPQS